MLPFPSDQFPRDSASYVTASAPPVTRQAVRMALYTEIAGFVVKSVDFRALARSNKVGVRKGDERNDSDCGQKVKVPLSRC